MIYKILSFLVHGGWIYVVVVLIVILLIIKRWGSRYKGLNKIDKDDFIEISLRKDETTNDKN